MTAPRMPSGLRKEERAAWRHLLADIGADRLEPSDRPIVLSAALLSARLEDIRAELQHKAESGNDDDGRGYLWASTARGGWTSNPLISQERETVKEIRLLHERLEKVLAARGSAGKKPSSLAEMRRDLKVVGKR